MVIETLLDRDTLFIEELIGRLKAVEEQYDLRGGSSDEASSSLNLTEDELVASIWKVLMARGGWIAYKKFLQQHLSKVVRQLWSEASVALAYSKCKPPIHNSSLYDL